MPTSIEDLVALSRTDQQLNTSQRRSEQLEQQIMEAREPLSHYESELEEKKEQFESVTLINRDAQKKNGGRRSLYQQSRSSGSFDQNGKRIQRP